MKTVEIVIDSGGVALRGHLARPAGEPEAQRLGLVLCHGFPSGPPGSGSGTAYSQLADRLSAESAWVVLSFNCRGTGESKGNFSLGGWLAWRCAPPGRTTGSGVRPPSPPRPTSSTGPPTRGSCCAGPVRSE